MNPIYRALTLGAVALYAALGLVGWEQGSGGKRQIPSSVRQSPGGNRSFHFWHSGIHGGK
jgi:hypothetical protein